MKTAISTLTGLFVSSICIVILVMSGISYANANITIESTFVMCSVPLTAEAETASDTDNEIQVYTSDDDTDSVNIENVEDVIIEDVIKPEPAEPDVSRETLEDYVKETEAIEPEPVPTQTEESDIEEIIITDVTPSESATGSTPTASSEPVVPEPIVVNYVSGQLPLGNYAFGTYVGRLSIPSVGIDVAVYHSNSQSVVDAIDSAGAYYGYESQPDYANYAFVIADHNTQGFNAIKNCVIGTEAYITTSSGTYSYVCDRIIYNGHNEGYGILDENYNLVYNQENGGMWLQTCNDTWENDTLVHFYHK